MNGLKVVSICALVALLSACGGKKKEDTTPDDTAATDNGSGDTGGGDSSASGTDPAVAASLQQVVYFEFDSSDLDDSARTKLNENASWLREDGVRTLTIEGHTDEVGTPGYNLALGERRARMAQEYLTRLGIKAERVRIITYGEEKPASDKDELNRRTMFVATKKK